MLITAAWARAREKRFIIGPNDQFELAVLTAGQTVRRWTSVAADGRVFVPMPCHPRQHVTVSDPRSAYQAQCRLCGRAYDLELIDENDGGWAAVLTCVDIEILLSRALRSERRRSC
ncbi:hypothetical protein PV458_31105 [Streptomyces sp. MN03-5084-2B]|nr:hypothetical protein [Streptomyces sp. MN03-5084-2B]